MPASRRVLDQVSVPDLEVARPRRRLDRRHRRRRAPGRRAATRGSGCSTGEPLPGRLAGQAARLRAAGPARPRGHGARLRRRRRGPRAAGAWPRPCDLLRRSRARPASAPTRGRSRRRWSERLVQPLLQWSWLTLLPLRLRRALAAAVARRPPTGSSWRSTPTAYRRGRRARGGAHRGARRRRAGPRGEGRRRARRRRRRHLAGDLPDVRRLADAARRLHEVAWAAFGSPAGAAAVVAAARPALRRAAARRRCAARWSGSSATAPAVAGRVLVARAHRRPGLARQPRATRRPSCCSAGSPRPRGAGTCAATCAGRAARCRAARR